MIVLFDRPMNMNGIHTEHTKSLETLIRYGSYSIKQNMYGIK